MGKETSKKEMDFCYVKLDTITMFDKLILSTSTYDID